MKIICILQNVITRVASARPKTVLAPVLPLSHRGKENTRQALHDKASRVSFFLLQGQLRGKTYFCVFYRTSQQLIENVAASMVSTPIALSPEGQTHGVVLHLHQMETAPVLRDCASNECRCVSTLLLASVEEIVYFTKYNPTA